ncbi:MAG: dipeptidase [Gammaproteobacteria bacterium]
MKRIVRLTVIPLASLLVFIGLSAMASAQTSAEMPQANVILSAFEEATPQDFSTFLNEVSALPSSNGVDYAALLERYRTQEPVQESERNALYRLLGLYTRTKYADDALQTLRELVAIPTFNSESIVQHENPEFHRFAIELQSLAESFNLAFRNVGGRIYEVSLGEPKGELIGVHAHADVVPVNPELWVLEDGTKLDPFVVTQIGNRLYGRGTQDDKNGIVVSMYAMRVVQDENLPLLRHFKLLVDTREETGGDAMPYYFERNPIPDYNIALDGSYPVIIAEKGYGTIMASFPFRAASGEGAQIVQLTGGLATNQIPASTSVWLTSTRGQSLLTRINQEGAVFSSTNGSDFAINARLDGERVRVDVLGVSAHSSEPESGVNPVSRMFAFINGLVQQGLVQENHFTDAALYATENWGMNYLGTQLQIAYADSFMGPLTASQTFVAIDGDQLRTAVNLRLPVGRDPQTLVSELEETLGAWAETHAVEVSFNISASEPMYRNPEGAWINALLDIAVENLGISREFGSSAGGTSIHDLPNGVQFGLALATEKYTGHNANEFKTVDQFLLDLQIATEMFARLGGMPEL